MSRPWRTRTSLSTRLIRARIARCWVTVGATRRKKSRAGAPSMAPPKKRQSFTLPNLSLPEGVDGTRFDSRLNILKQIDDQRKTLDSETSADDGIVDGYDNVTPTTVAGTSLTFSIASFRTRRYSLGGPTAV